MPGERKRYVNLITDVIVGAEAARVVMASAVKRVEKSPLCDETASDDAD